MHLVHCCSHFSQSYGVNRFLVILMAKLLPDVVQCHKGCAVNKVESHDPHTHVCDLTQANACNYAPHVVHIQKNAECIFQDKRAAFRTIEADLVIVRHGPDFKKASPPLPRPRHLLPYYLAWER